MVIVPELTSDAGTVQRYGHWWRAPASWIAVAWLAIALATAGDYGLTWDEGVQSRYGELVLRYFTSGLSDRSANEFLDLKLYGPLFETGAAAVYQFTPQWKIGVRHVLIALTGFLAIIGAARSCSALSGSAEFAALALIFTPQFYGHSFNNSKDIPFACASIWFFFGMVKLLREKTPGAAVLAGLAGGAMLGIRVGGLLLLGIAAMAAVFEAVRARDRRLPLLFGLMTAIAWTLMVAVWPWAQVSPILNPLRGFRASTAFTSRYPVLFEGMFRMSDELPRRYLLEMLTITTPLALLTLGLLGLLIALSAARRGDTSRLLLVAWIAGPIFLFTILRPNVYDGIRHFLFLLPALAVAVGVACRFLVDRISLRRGVTTLTLGAAIVAPIFSMLALHPYQSSYYNALVGGTRGAAARFDTDYWASSYREAALWLRSHSCAGRPTRLLVAANSYSLACLTSYLPASGFTVRRMMDTAVALPLPREFDYYVATTRYGLHLNFDATPVSYVVGRQGAAFTVVRGGCRRDSRVGSP